MSGYPNVWVPDNFTLDSFTADRPPCALRSVPERQDVRIALYDMLGRRVQTVVDTDAEGRTEQPLDVSGLASGTYFLRMQTDGHTATQRVTVVR